MPAAKRKKKRQSMPEVPDVEYHVSRSRGGDAVISVPADWKLTFGFVNPSKSGDSYARGEGHCLRIYEGEKLRGAISNVTGFRDLAIPFAVKVEKEVGESKWESDSAGNFKKSEEVKVLEAEYDEDNDSPF